MKLDIDDREKFIKQMDDYLNTRIIGSSTSVDDLKGEISRVDEMAMSYHKSTNAIYMKIRKAINALESGKPEKAEIILLRMIKDAT